MTGIPYCQKPSKPCMVRVSISGKLYLRKTTRLTLLTLGPIQKYEVKATHKAKKKPLTFVNLDIGKGSFLCNLGNTRSYTRIMLGIAYD